jgi:hypothetical protein
LSTISADVNPFPYQKSILTSEFRPEALLRTPIITPESIWNKLKYSLECLLNNFRKKDIIKKRNKSNFYCSSSVYDLD